MKKQKIICHILQSMDGRIDGAFFQSAETMPALQEYARIRDTYACDAVISGAATAAEIYGDGFIHPLPKENLSAAREDWTAALAQHYAVVIDGAGTVCWNRGTAVRGGKEMQVIAVLQENVPDAYLRMLRKAGVSYLFAGRERLDLPLAVEKLSSQYGIETMLLSGGGVVDYAFLQAGLIDEISLVVVLVVDGGAGLASAFDESPYAKGGPVGLRLLDCQQLAGGALWIRYGCTQKQP